MTSGSADSSLMPIIFLAVVRGLGTEILVCPLELIKLRQQCSNKSESSYKIARQIFQNEGIRSFYDGLSPQLLKTCVKQAWCWPMIIELPKLFRSYGLNDCEQQIATGISISTVDSLGTIHLEKVRVVYATAKKTSLPLIDILKEGWKGFSTYWIKRSVNRVTFLTAQEYLRKNNREGTKELKAYEMLKVGVEVAFVVSFVGAPFDFSNTLKQAKNLNSLHLLNRKDIVKLYRGWPMNTLSLIIQNIASIFLFEKLRQNN